MSVQPQESLTTILVFLITSVVLFTAYVRYSYSYWKRRKVPYLEPKFPFGNNNSLVPKGVSVGVISKEFYNKFKKLGHHMVGGVYIGIQPALVVLNPDLIRDIFVKDFPSFTDRGVYYTDSDPLTVHLFSQPGTQWKNTRTKLTSVFTSAKMKAMFQTMLDCSAGLIEELEKLSDQKSDVDMLEVAACFTTDVIGSCAFGIDCNSFKYPDAEFRRMGHKYFTEHSFLDRANLFFSNYAPNISQRLGVRNVQKEVSRFFFQSIQGTVSYRENNEVHRNDMLQMLIDMKNSEDVRLSMKELTAQVFLFFTAGFETSSSTTTLALFEISKNEEVQKKLREEIRGVLKKYDDQITYDGIAEMKFLDHAVAETLRLWPPISTLTRVCTKDRKLQGTDVIVKKGTFILIPALGLHHDAEYWPDPTRWDPDRFKDGNKESRRPFTYLPFGEGPRNCIALRFGLLQTKIALVTILSKYKVTLSPKTTMPLGLQPNTFVLQTINKVYVNLMKI